MLANQVVTNKGLLLSSKYVSERHAIASQTKYTAGEAAKELKKMGLKLSAKELVSIYKTLAGKEPEWHHAGFYNANGHSTMGRTFFFTEENIQFIFDNIDKVAEIEAAKEAERKAKEENVICGFFYSWSHDYSGNYGKKRNFKILKAYKGSELNKPQNFTSLSESGYQKALELDGRKYFGWDEPTASEFEIL